MKKLKLKQVHYFAPNPIASKDSEIKTMAMVDNFEA